MSESKQDRYYSPEPSPEVLEIREHAVAIKKHMIDLGQLNDNPGACVRSASGSRAEKVRRAHESARKARDATDARAKVTGRWKRVANGIGMLLAATAGSGVATAAAGFFISVSPALVGPWIAAVTGIAVTGSAASARFKWSERSEARARQLSYTKTELARALQNGFVKDEQSDIVQVMAAHREDALLLIMRAFADCQDFDPALLSKDLNGFIAAPIPRPTDRQTGNELASRRSATQIDPSTGLARGRGAAD